MTDSKSRSGTRRYAFITIPIGKDRIRWGPKHYYYYYYYYLYYYIIIINLKTKPIYHGKSKIGPVIEFIRNKSNDTI